MSTLTEVSLDRVETDFDMQEVLDWIMGWIPPDVIPKLIESGVDLSKFDWFSCGK